MTTRTVITKIFWLFLPLFFCVISFAQSPTPPANVRAHDTPGDAGGSITVTWQLSPDDQAEKNVISGYEIFRATNPDGEYISVGFAPSGVAKYKDATTTDRVTCYYKVGASDGKSVALSGVSNPVASSPQWFNSSLLNLFIIGTIISIAIIYFIASARSGKKLFLRKIAGLQAVDEAIGRATEMGRSILFIPGIHDMDDVQTIAGLTILSRIAKTIAEYDTRMKVPVSRSIVLASARETLKEAYLSAGRPDAYSDDMVQYLTDEQFGYVAAVDGMMVREKPATCFYLGAFFAESLLIAETGNFIGAIQIAGTAQPAQLPFFVAACDYTLIGEELFAASAYLSNEPKQLGSLKGQDVGKAIALIAILVGALTATFAVITGSPFLMNLTTGIARLFKVTE